MPVTAGVTEELGSEIHVLFSIDAPQVQHASITQAAAGDDDDEAIPLAGGKSLWTARVAARSTVKPGSAASSSRWTRPTCSSSTPRAGWRSAAATGAVS